MEQQTLLSDINNWLEGKLSEEAFLKFERRLWTDNVWRRMVFDLLPDTQAAKEGRLYNQFELKAMIAPLLEEFGSIDDNASVIKVIDPLEAMVDHAIEVTALNSFKNKAELWKRDLHNLPPPINIDNRPFKRYRASFIFIGLVILCLCLLGIVLWGLTDTTPKNVPVAEVKTFHFVLSIPDSSLMIEDSIVYRLNLPKDISQYKIANWSSTTWSTADVWFKVRIPYRGKIAVKPDGTTNDFFESNYNHWIETSNIEGGAKFGRWDSEIAQIIEASATEDWINSDLQWRMRAYVAGDWTDITTKTIGLLYSKDITKLKVIIQRNGITSDTFLNVIPLLSVKKIDSNNIYARATSKKRTPLRTSTPQTPSEWFADDIDNMTDQVMAYISDQKGYVSEDESSTFYEQGKDYYVKKDYQQALEYLEKVDSSSKNYYYRTQMILSDIYRQQKNYPKAIQCFEKYSEASEGADTKWRLLMFYLMDYEANKDKFKRKLEIMLKKGAPANKKRALVLRNQLLKQGLIEEK